jgi:hypothetical protein
MTFIYALPFLAEARLSSVLKISYVSDESERSYTYGVGSGAFAPLAGVCLGTPSTFEMVGLYVK